MKPKEEVYNIKNVEENLYGQTKGQVAGHRYRKKQVNNDMGASLTFYVRKAHTIRTIQSHKIYRSTQY